MSQQVEVRRTTSADAEAVYAVVHAAFAARPTLDPPADALAETVESLRDRVADGGGLIAELDGAAVGALLLDPIGATVFVRRFSVEPSAQGAGVARALIDAALAQATEADEVAVLARQELPATIAFWEHNGFREVSRRAPLVELRRPVRGLEWTAADADEMRAAGERLGALLRAGDLLILSGELGAGKTTLTQGIAAGVGVRGPITSPTFVLARVHPSLVGGPSLVHVDAYRLGSLDELDDLDLDTDLDTAVTIVEWGAGMAEGLAGSRLDVRIERAVADDEGDGRRVTVTGIGERWHGGF